MKLIEVSVQQWQCEFCLGMFSFRADGERHEAYCRALHAKERALHITPGDKIIAQVYLGDDKDGPYYDTREVIVIRRNNDGKYLVESKDGTRHIVYLERIKQKICEEIKTH